MVPRRFSCLAATLLVGCGLVAAPGARSSGDRYTFSTVAGVPGTVVKSADGTAGDAQFDSPRGVAVDGAGNVYVADSANNTIRKITPAGVTTTIAGSAGHEGRQDGDGSLARFIEPFGITADRAGTLYVADTSNNAIRRITTSGSVTTLAGGGAPGSADGTGSAARFDEPRGVTVDANGTVYVADYDNHTIRKVTADGVVTTLAGQAHTPGHADGAGTAALFRDPMGVALDPSGVLYVADTGNRAIRKIEPGGRVTTVTLTGGALSEPRGVAVSPSGDIVVADYGSHTIKVITPTGRVSLLAGRSQPGTTDGVGSNAAFHYPSAVALDTAGIVYVADTENDTIRAVRSDGSVSTFAGAPGRTSSTDGAATDARFEDPFAIASDARGVAYVADSAAHAIRRISADGVVTTIAGLPGSFGSSDGRLTDARFNSPYGIAVDATGVVFVADSLNSTVRKIALDGTVTTIAGAAGERGSRDGHGREARFDQPFGIAVDANGTIYVSDARANTIRAITAERMVTTLAGAAGSAGSADGVGALARFTVPYGVGVDRLGNVYVSDHGNHAIRKITPNGTVTTLAGTAGQVGSADGEGAAARFRFPSHLAVDGSGNVAVADTDNHAIRLISPSGGVETVGGGGAPGASDGDGAAARFFNPKGIAASREGTLLVADRGNHTIRKGTPRD